MKYFILLLLGSFSAWAQTPFADVTLSQPSRAAVSATCPGTNTTPQVDIARNFDNYNFGASSSKTWIGQTWTPGSNTNVCAVAFQIETIAGDTSGKALTASIRTFNSPFWDNVLGTASVSGYNDGNFNWIIFVFSSPVALTSGTQYLIVCSVPSTDASNFYRIGITSSAGLGSDDLSFGHVSDWSGAGTEGGFHMAIKLWMY